ncbi:MAG: N-acetylmuramic acid 6-phosphate etherase, partial [Sciscionella sp.]
TNAKLRGRTLRILSEASGASDAECGAALQSAGGDLKIALVELLSTVDVEAATAALRESGGHVGQALELLNR